MITEEDLPRISELCNTMKDDFMNTLQREFSNPSNDAIDVGLEAASNIIAQILLQRSSLTSADNALARLMPLMERKVRQMITEVFSKEDHKTVSAKISTAFGFPPLFKENEAN